MSDSQEPIPPQRKRKLTERAMNNGDPLLAKKKAKEATAATPALGKKTVKVCSIQLRLPSFLISMLLIP